MSDGNQLPPAGETACPTSFAKRLMQQGGAGGFACRSHGHNQWSASKMNKFPKTVKHPTDALRCFSGNRLLSSRLDKLPANSSFSGISAWVRRADTTTFSIVALSGGVLDL